MEKAKSTSTKRQGEQAKNKKKEENLIREEIEKEKISSKTDINVKDFIQRNINSGEPNEKNTNKPLAWCKPW